MNKLPEKIIVMRHGESESDKTNPMRKLTQNGVQQINLASKTIGKKIKRPSIIVCSNTFRTIQTSDILAKELNIKFVVSRSKLRIKEGQQIPLTGNEAKKMARRFMRLVNKFNYVNTLIIVGNSGGLEAFINFQRTFVSKKKVLEELKYAEFVILGRK